MDETISFNGIFICLHIDGSVIYGMEGYVDDINYIEISRTKLYDKD